MSYFDLKSSIPAKIWSMDSLKKRTTGKKRLRKLNEIVAVFAMLIFPMSAASGQQAKVTVETQDTQMLDIAKQAGSRAARVMEKWVSSGEVSEEKLFSRLYFPVLDVNAKEPKLLYEPPKFSTDYDKLADRDLRPIEDAYMSRSSDIVFVIVIDKNGYIPAHISRFSQTFTGDPKADQENNRTKRIFCDRAGLQAARNTNPYLLQSYKRDTGETMNDLSVPIYVNGRHWGALRIAYRVASEN